jgi:type IV fimbrial biogenesis protein FimT
LETRFLKKQRGVTPVEMLLALCIIALLVAIGIPSFQDTLAKSRQRSLARALSEGLAQTRLEALKLNTRVTMCPSIDGFHCTDANNWESGWIIFRDDDLDGKYDGDERVFHYQESVFMNVTARGNRLIGTYVSFTGDGRPQTRNGALQMGTFTVCGKTHTALNVVIAISGRTRIEQSATGC